MRNILLRVIIFIIIVSALFAFNLFVFRSDYPQAWWVSLTASIISLIFFPYQTFFNIKNKK